MKRSKKYKVIKQEFTSPKQIEEMLNGYAEDGYKVKHFEDTGESEEANRLSMFILLEQD